MVTGLDRFKEYFAGLEDVYAIIGGVACEHWIIDAGGNFRTTKDFDLVILVEELSTKFYEQFWTFIEKGRYQIREVSERKPQAYRFRDPLEADFPSIIELFTRNHLGLPADARLTPIPAPEDLSGLSAILLDDDCYKFVLESRRVEEGLSLVPPFCLMPLKARAWLNLKRDEAADDSSVDVRNIKKHRNDVFQLYRLLAPSDRYTLPATLRSDFRKFLSNFTEDSREWGDIRKSVGKLGLLEPRQVVRQLHEIFQLDEPAAGATEVEPVS